MNEKIYISYSKYYKPKDISELFPEYLIHRLKNKDKPQPHINYSKCFNAHK